MVRGRSVTRVGYTMRNSRESASWKRGRGGKRLQRIDGSAGERTGGRTGVPDLREGIDDAFLYLVYTPNAGRWIWDGMRSHPPRLTSPRLQVTTPAHCKHVFLLLLEPSWFYSLCTCLC